MKRIISFLVLLIITAAVSYSDTIINDIDNFSKLFPRSEGSINEKQTINYIKTRLEETGAVFNLTNFEDAEGYHSFSSCIDVIIPGKSEETLITVVPVDLEGSVNNRFSGCWSMAAALHMAEYFTGNPPDITMRFLFLGAENGSPGKPLGTRYFLEHFYSESSAIFIYFNIEGIPSSLRIRSGADGYSSPYNLFHLTTEALSSAGISWFHSNTESILFRLSSVEAESHIMDYLKEGFPAIELGMHSEQGDMISGIELENFYKAMEEELASGFPDEWDIHYIFGISEWNYLIIYISMITLLMVYPIFRRKHFGWYMRTLFKNFWSIPILFGFTFGLLALSSIITGRFLSVINFPELWRYRPLSVFLLKISTALFFYSVSFRVIRRLPFSRRGSFYSISAVFFLTAGLFVLTWLDLSLSFFALWPLFLIFLFTIAKRPLVKFLLLLVSCLWVFIVLIEVFQLPSYTVIKLISLSTIKGNMLSALIMLPFILAAIRLDLMAPVSKKITRFAPHIFIVLSTGLLLSMLFWSPFDDAHPQPVFISETINTTDGSRNLSVDSPAPVDSELRNEFVRMTEEDQQISENISMELSTRSFLNRKILDFNLSFEGQPETVSIFLNSPGTITIYESSFPARWFPSEGRIEVFIGKNPPAPLGLSMTINRTAVFDVVLKAGYPVTVKKINIDGNAYSVSRQRTIIRTYSDAN